MVKSGTVGGESTVAPFLKKCYEMVDDESTNSIISWGQEGNSFVIWNMTEFSVQLLPNYFKHSNFSSFIRQLNIYGFKKIDTDSWEFASDGFIKGQKHLLKTITRRKNSQVTEQRKPPQQENDTIEHTGKEESSGLREEVENLKICKNGQMQELVKLKQHHEISKNKVLVLRDRLHGMEKAQQQMLSFLVMIMQNPGYLVQLLQPKENNWRMGQPVSIVEQDAEDAITPVASNGIIVSYKPLVEGMIPEPLLAPTPTASENLQEPSPSNDFFLSSDFLKGLMDESIYPFENQTGAFILPELSDDHSWEQLISFNPFLENVENDKREDEGNPAPEANTGYEKMDMPANLEKGNGALSDGSENMEVLTQEMGLLASEPTTNMEYSRKKAK